MEISPKLKAILLFLYAIVIVVVIVLAFIFIPKDDDTPAPPAFILQTVNLPSDVSEPMYPHYTASGNIVFQYKNTTNNQIYVGVVNDDGSNLRIIYDSEPKPFYNNTNGVRLMPFKDNKRILLGDGIIECEPSIDEVTDPSTQTKVIPVEYPEKLLNLQGLFMLWSEIIISSDNIHMGWNCLLTSGALVFISRLKREVSKPNQPNFFDPRLHLSNNKYVPNDVKYVMENVQVVSDLAYAYKDPDHPGYIIPPKYIHGGEIKQFTFDCQQITLVGASSSGLARSVLQNLDDEIVRPIGHEPGYEETTIISPDGKLGVVMSTRFSPKTSCRILGLIPRPYSSLGMMSFAQAAYTYSVTGVRLSRKGNIGPALIEIEKSMEDTDYERKYHGADLHDPDDKFVFRSPMSWHFSSSKAIWLEGAKNDETNLRIRQVVLDSSSYPPGEPLKCEKETPDNIPYAYNIDILDNLSVPLISGKIASPLGEEKGGYIQFEYSQIHNNLTYFHFSDDGINFYDGSEGYTMNIQIMASSYEGKIVMKDNNENIIGDMDFKVAFSAPTNDMKLIREQSYGKATYKGETATVDEMED